MVSGIGGTQGSSTSLSPNWASGMTRGTLYIIVINTAVGNTMVCPSEWTLLYSLNVGKNVYYRYGDGLGVSYTPTFSWNTASVLSYQILEISATQTGQGINASLGGSGLSTTPTAPSITPKYNACMLVSVYCGRAANAITIPGGQTSTGLGSSATGNSSSTNSGYEYLTSNAATGTRAASSASMTWDCYNFAIAPITTSGGIILPDGWNSYAGTPNTAPGNSSQYGGINIGFGSAAVISREMPRTSTGLWVGSAPYAGARGGIDGLATGYTGVYKISGTVTSQGIVAKKRIFVSPRQAPSIIIGEVYSDPSTGYFEFNNLAPGLYDVYGMDQDNVCNDAFQALVQAVPM